MKVLITGGAGYIGSHLVDALIKRGDKVWVVDNLATGRADNIQHHLGRKEFHFVNDSILNEALLERIVPTVDAIYHLAAAVGVRHILADPLGHQHQRPRHRNGPGAGLQVLEANGPGP